MAPLARRSRRQTELSAFSTPTIRLELASSDALHFDRRPLRQPVDGCKLGCDDAHGLGIYVESSSGVGGLERSIGGNFKRMLPFLVRTEDGRLPAGGAVAMILTKDSVKQKAAWEYIKYVTGLVDQTLMVLLRGYAPGNQKALDDPKLLGGYYEQRPNYAPHKQSR